MVKFSFRYNSKLMEIWKNICRSQTFQNIELYLILSFKFVKLFYTASLKPKWVLVKVLRKGAINIEMERYWDSQKVTSFEAGLNYTNHTVFLLNNFGPSKATRMVKVPLESSCHSPSSSTVYIV